MLGPTTRDLDFIGLLRGPGSGDSNVQTGWGTSDPAQHK